MRTLTLIVHLADGTVLASAITTVLLRYIAGISILKELRATPSKTTTRDEDVAAAKRSGTNHGRLSINTQPAEPGATVATTTTPLYKLHKLQTNPKFFFKMLQMVAVLAVAGLASAATIPTRYAQVYNMCKFDVSVFDVRETVGDEYRLKAGQIYTSPYPKEGAPTSAFKITRGADGLRKGEPQLDFSFAVGEGKVYYDLSETYGDAFKGFKVKVIANDDSCPKITWDNGTPPAGSHAGSCSADVAVVVGLCA